MKFCIKCGSELKEGSKFCHVCGNQTINSPQAASVQQYVPRADNPNLNPKPDVVNKNVYEGSFSMKENPVNGHANGAYNNNFNNRSLENPSIMHEKSVGKPKKGLSVYGILLITMGSLILVALLVFGAIVLKDKLQQKSDNTAANTTSAAADSKDTSKTKTADSKNSNNSNDPKTQTDNKDSNADTNSAGGGNDSGNGAVNQDTAKQPDEVYVKNVIGQYENGLIEAINNNNFSIVEPFLIPGSSLYDAQQKLVVNLNKQNIKETLLGFDIVSIDKVDNTYKVKVSERFNINYNGTVKRQDFTFVYTVKYSGDRWGLSDIAKG